MLSLFILISLGFAWLTANALFIWLGSKLVKVGGVTFGRAFVAAIAVGLLSVLLHVGFSWLWSEAFDIPLLCAGIEFGVNLLLVGLTLKALLRTSLWRAIISWVPTVLPATIALGLLYFVLHPFVFAFFVTPNQAMAPTLLGPHQQGVCPICGQVSTIHYDADAHIPFGFQPVGMCSSCQQASVLARIDPEVLPPDRFMVNKLLSPRRWDLIVFRHNRAPSVQLVKRLIGLPGEEVTIKNGGIWINGSRQEPPPEIAKLKFVSALEGEENAFGSPERPVRLGQEEYFVIGDFSLHSADSRAWGAVPARNIEGVVALIYWPPSRWRILK
jgi:signal peptidase I